VMPAEEGRRRQMPRKHMRILARTLSEKRILHAWCTK